MVYCMVLMYMVDVHDWHMMYMVDGLFMIHYSLLTYPLLHG
jgi:hypothetical protein